MKIKSEKITHTLNKVRVLREHLEKACPNPQGLVIDPDDVLWAVQDIYGISIEMIEVSFVGEFVGGKLERYSDKRARVLVRSAQTEDMKRFVAVKELCHVAVDEEDDWSTLGVNTIKDLLTEWELIEKNGDGHENPEKPLASEILAEIAAVEIMYPQKYREADQLKLANGETSIAQIALEHKIPPFVVETALDHQDILADVWKAISEASK